MRSCKYPDCFNCILPDCVMEDGDISEMLRGDNKVRRGSIRVLTIHNEDFVVRVRKVFERDGEEWCEVKPVNFIGDAKNVRASLLT